MLSTKFMNVPRPIYPGNTVAASAQGDLITVKPEGGGPTPYSTVRGPLCISQHAWLTEEATGHGRMYGSCCEEQEAKEAAAREKIAGITRATEEKLMKGYHTRLDVHKKLRCFDSCCAQRCDLCCEDNEASNLDISSTPRASSDGDSDMNSDLEDEDIMARLRATRIQEMQANALSKRLSRRGTHTRLGSDESLEWVLSDPAETSPVIAHISSGDDESTIWVETLLRRMAYKFPYARLVSDISCTGGRTPEYLPFVHELPVIILAESGLIVSVCTELAKCREHETVHEVVSSWLQTAHAHLASSLSRNDDDEQVDDGEEIESYCGRPGCRTYKHEHVGSKTFGGGPRRR